MMKHFLAAAVLSAGFVSGISAQEQQQELIRLDMDARIDYQRLYNDGHAIHEKSGFFGEYFFLRADGRITPSLSYSWRQRVNKPNGESSFFSATDWLWVNYDVAGWSLSGGKQEVLIGGWEYDRAPIDLYSCSLFWQNIAPFQYAVSAGYRLTEGDKLTFQFSESPFMEAEGNDRDMYAYNLFWSGNHGAYSALWSANLMEYARGRFISYLALGNRFSFDKVNIELDVMNRAADHQTFLLRDMSVMGEVKYSPDSRWTLYGKYTYDVNRTHTLADRCVLPGTELNMAGAGFEFYPLRKKRTSLRLHANCFYSWGTNSNGGDTMQNKSLIFDVGVKWHINLLSFTPKK